MVTVAVLPVFEINNNFLDDKDITYDCYVGSGPGGQHRNKTASTVRAKHIPTGMTVIINNRDQHANKRQAYQILKSKVNNFFSTKEKTEFNNIKKIYLQNRGRGNKVRTYNFLKSRVTNHITNKQTHDIKSVMKGCLELCI